MKALALSMMFVFAMAFVAPIAAQDAPAAAKTETKKCCHKDGDEKKGCCAEKKECSEKKKECKKDDKACCKKGEKPAAATTETK